VHQLVKRHTHTHTYIYIYIYILTAIGLSPGGSTHLHTNNTENNTNNNRTTQITTNVKVRAVPRLCEFYPGICLTTEEKARKTLNQGKKYLSQVKKNLSQSTVYILPKHPHITKFTHTHTHTYTLQNNIKPPQYKLKQMHIGKATQLGERTIPSF
jgi:hypothetical protein